MPLLHRLDYPTPYHSVGYWLRALLPLLAFVALMALAPVRAAGSDTKIDTDVVLDTVRTEIATLQKKLAAFPKEPLDDTQLAQLRAKALDAQAKAEAAGTAIEPELTSVQARLAELGTPTDSAPDAPDIAVQRKQLTKSSSTLDAQIKLARLISVEAGQAAEQILKFRRAQFQEQLGQRTSSILVPTFWEELADESERDLERLEPLRTELNTAFKAGVGGVWLVALLGTALVIALRLLAGRILFKISTTRVAPGRLRRSLYAVSRVILAAAVPALIAQIFSLAIGWNSALSDTMESVLDQLVGIACFGGFVAGLGNALLAPDRPSWRLPSMDDAQALKLRWFPLLLAIVLCADWGAQRLATLINASLIVTVAIDCIMALTISLMLGMAMQRARRTAIAAQDTAAKGTPALASPWLNLLLNVIWTAITVAIVSLLLGYVALGSFITKQVVWIGLVVGTTYLITGLIEDGGNSLLASAKRAGTDDHNTPPMSRARNQAIVLLSGITRVLVVLFAFMLLLSPFGGGPTEWLRQIDHLHSGIAIGEIQVRPTSVILAILVLLLGFGAVKLLQRWLAAQYLPTTSLDPGMRLSAATLFGYAGYVIVASFSLSAVGIGLERVAWIASALSVGIGFGLQAVVQNFVSGLILLADRPVKVGDWVSLGGVEGDIRRINVRATEIQMSDRSTVIVPNSEFITKVVRNVTHGSPLGRVQIKLALPIDTHAERVHDLMLAVFQENSEILDEPMPDVMLDGIDATGLIFSATGYVGSPRSAYRVRSAVLFEILKQLHEAKLPLVSPPTMILKESAPSQPGLPTND